MGGLARAWLDLDIAVRAYTARAGTSPHARALTAALTNFRRAAGLSWQDMAEVVNQAAEHNRRG